MSATTALIQQLARRESSTEVTDGTDESDGAAAADAESGGLSRADVKAASKEGAAEAVSEYRERAPAPATAADEETSADDGATSASSGGSSLKRVLLLGVVTVYLLRRRRRGRSADSQ